MDTKGKTETTVVGFGRPAKKAGFTGLLGRQGRAELPGAVPGGNGGNGALIRALSPPPGKVLPLPLGPPLGLREVAQLIGCSPWTVRLRLLPKGLPHFRIGASGKLIFYTNQVVAWIVRRQGGTMP